MKLSDLKPHDDLRLGRYSNDPRYAVVSDRTSLADQVRVAVVHYRAVHGLSHSAFADLLGWKQPHFARLERGDITPSAGSLEQLARAGVVEVHIERAGTRVQGLAAV